MEFIGIADRISGFIWGNGLVFLLLFTGAVYTFRTGFVQFRFIHLLAKELKKSGKSAGSGISQFKTICLSLGTAMGTGNITGVASALSLGGAGAVFWMWISAFFGMALVYGENYLAVKFRKDGLCGPMAYMKNALGFRILPYIFAFSCLAASLGMGGMVQVSSFADSFYEIGNFSPIITAVAAFLLIYTVITGGAERIGSASQILLPAASAVYFVISAAVIFRFRERLPLVFQQIFSEAFSFDSALGGITGFSVSKAVSVGIRRGIFSNEAGLGSSPILHSTSENPSARLQGLCGSFEVFFDTIICCTLTAVTLLSSCTEDDFSVTSAFSCAVGNSAPLIVSALLGIYAFCTIIGWYFCGETALSFLLGRRIKGRAFPIIFAGFSALGAAVSLRTVFTLSDIFNGLMAFPNLLSLILLAFMVKF